MTAKETAQVFGLCAAALVMCFASAAGSSDRLVWASFFCALSAAAFAAAASLTWIVAVLRRVQQMLRGDDTP